MMLQGDCITAHRIQMAAVESDASEISKDVPLGILDPKRFNTLRYRYVGHHILGKTMSDLSRTHGRFTKDSVLWVHRFMDWCRQPWSIPDSLLRIHHYTGSWESYSFRNDKRKGGIKNRQIWEYEASVKGECRFLHDVPLTISCGTDYCCLLFRKTMALQTRCDLGFRGLSDSLASSYLVIYWRVQAFQIVSSTMIHKHGSMSMQAGCLAKATTVVMTVSTVTQRATRLHHKWNQKHKSLAVPVSYSHPSAK
jgi:hypothetical protein